MKIWQLGKTKNLLVDIWYQLDEFLACSDGPLGRLVSRSLVGLLLRSLARLHARSLARFLGQIKSHQTIHFPNQINQTIYFPMNSRKYTVTVKYLGRDTSKPTEP